QALTPVVIATVLTDFHHWLTALAAGPATPITAATEPGPDLFTLLGQMTALRHEVNLQTKAVRAQQETTTTTLQELENALEALERRAADGEAGPASAEAAI